MLQKHYKAAGRTTRNRKYKEQNKMHTDDKTNKLNGQMIERKEKSNIEIAIKRPSLSSPLHIALPSYHAWLIDHLI